MSNSIPRNEAPIGLVIVHGIGNQRPGTLSRRVANRLAHSSADDVADLPADPVESENPEETATTTPIQRITVGDAPVLVREAHWASLSHPDNPPRIRRTLYLFRDLVDTVSWAWYASPPATAIRRLGRGVTPVLSLIGGAIFTLVLIALGLVSVLAADQSDAGALVSLVAAGILGALLLPIVLYQMYRILRNIYLRTRHAGQLKRVASVVLWVPIAYGVGTMRLLFLLVSAELLVLFFPVVLVAVALDSIASLPTRAFAGTGRILGKLRLKGVQRWVHRLGWVIVVMPVHSFLQAVKANGNLVSVLLTEKDLVPRTATVLWFCAVYGGFVVLLVFSEVMLLMLLFFAAFYWQFFAGFDWQSAADTRYLVYYAIGFGGYLIVLKGLLPVIDLILDIGNYHLASAADRRTYHERIEQAVESLLESGCREIHILAHSLGSVISYDWLVSQRADGYPVTVLHTIGSPLNKFWYLDHARSARLLDRQGLSRLGGRWTNYWAWSDIVSGFLARYGTDAGGVSNTRLRWLGIALFSHGHYWKNPVVLAGVRREIERSFRGAAGSSPSSDPSGNSMTSGTSR